MVIQSNDKYEVYAAEHRFLCNSYQYIAQRAREVYWPDKPNKEVVELLRDLERDFQLLKARGREPEERFFRSANKTFTTIRSDPNMSIAQSFDVA